LTALNSLGFEIVSCVNVLLRKQEKPKLEMETPSVGEKKERGEKNTSFFFFRTRFQFIFRFF